jgi:hypothetical protein
MSTIYLNTIVIFLIVSLVSASVPRTDVTVSGISSGGAMATQLHVAFSKDISGCGILAGPPFYCGGNGLTTALCMTGPSAYISVPTLESKIKSYFSLGSIDNPSNILNDPVYVFSGKYDSVASPAVVKLNEKLYSRLGANVKTNFDMAAEHCFPTENFGATCSTLNKDNFINKCDFNMAHDILNHLYGGNLVKPQVNSKTPLIGQMLLFNQEAFMNSPSSSDASSLSQWIQQNMVLYNPENWGWPTAGLFNLAIPSVSVLSDKTSGSLSGLDEQGFVYFPSKCANGQKCSIHVAIHGCQQGKSVVGDVFVREAGYLEVAELNNIIVIFPQVRGSLVFPTNPMGCWDWWGYSSVSYATKSGPQMSGIKKMIDTLRMINAAFTATN